MTAQPSAGYQDPAASKQDSPLWLGCRVSVVIPTYNRQEKLSKCLRALMQQSILPEEFEVIVVDDGSPDDTAKLLQEATFPFPLRYFHQDHRGPGIARNLGIQKAEGELVLFIGDDIIAHERLLENHLLAHAHFPAETTAILGYITWPLWMKPSRVMEYVYGESGRQFAYPMAELAPSLDYRWFYTSNISFKRRFLLSAADAGVRFDPSFRFAAWEDIDFGYRLQARGVQMHYWKDAIGYHDHWMDLQSFSRREYFAGQMAVVFNRKHPILDIVPFRTLNDWIPAVEALRVHPALLTTVQNLQKELDIFLHSLASSLEELLESNLSFNTGEQAPALRPQHLRQALYDCLNAIFTIESTRGYVEEWYAGVEDQTKTQIAKSLISSFKGLETLTGKGFDGKQQVIQALTAQLVEIRRSRTWKFALWLGQLRLRLLPRRQAARRG